MLIKLPFPDMRLSPNRKHGTHWTKTKDIKKAAFDCAYYITREAMARQTEKVIPKVLEITFNEPDHRKRDLDNMLSAIKNSIDGMCHALGINDHVFDRIILNRDYTPLNGEVLIMIWDKDPSPL